MWTGRGSWGRGWGFLVHRAKQQKGKLKDQRQCAQARLLTCRPAHGPNLVTHRLCGLDSMTLGPGVQEPKSGPWRKARKNAPPGQAVTPPCTFPAAAAPDLTGPTTDSASNALLLGQASPDMACLLPSSPSCWHRVAAATPRLSL